MLRDCSQDGCLILTNTLILLMHFFFNSKKRELLFSGQKLPVGAGSTVDPKCFPKYVESIQLSLFYYPQVKDE